MLALHVMRVYLACNIISLKTRTKAKPGWLLHGLLRLLLALGVFDLDLDRNGLGHLWLKNGH